jgi:effector-binding domain-containing protein
MEYHVDRIEMETQPTAVVRGTVAADSIADFLGGVYGEVLGVISAQGLVPSGPPFGRYVSTTDGFEIEAGFPASAAVDPTGRVVASELAGGPTLLVLHRGPYDAVAAAYAAAEGWLADNDWESTGPPWEAYLDGPEVAEPRTLVHVPVRPT